MWSECRFVRKSVCKWIHSEFRMNFFEFGWILVSFDEFSMNFLCNQVCIGRWICLLFLLDIVPICNFSLRMIFSRYFPLSVFYFVRVSTIFSRLSWFCFASVTRFCFSHQFVYFSCLHVFLLLFLRLSLTLGSWIRSVLPFSPSLVCLLPFSWFYLSFFVGCFIPLFALLHVCFHSLIPVVSFSFIFYSLPFSPMLWFSHSGDSFLLTNHFWKFLFSDLFFFSCCLLLLLLFFPPVFFVLFSSH